MILQPLIASLNPESLSMPTGTLRNKDASLSTFSLSTNSFSLPLYISFSLSLPYPPFQPFPSLSSLYPRQLSIRSPFPSRSTPLSPLLRFGQWKRKTRIVDRTDGAWWAVSASGPSNKASFSSETTQHRYRGNDSLLFVRHDTSTQSELSRLPSNASLLTDCKTTDFSKVALSFSVLSLSARYVGELYIGIVYISRLLLVASICFREFLFLLALLDFG